MPLIEYKGNIFNSRAQTLVNTVNCVGVMGKGVALEFRRRFPDMYEWYRGLCAANALSPGQIVLYTHSTPWILNFAVKQHWKEPSRIDWIDSCLAEFVAKYHGLGITSVAMPWLGAMNGGLPWENVHRLIRNRLSSLDDIEIELIQFDPDTPDAIYHRLTNAVRSMEPAQFSRRFKVKPQFAELIYDSILHKQVPSLARLLESDGVGAKTAETLYNYFRCDQLVQPDDAQLNLFGDQSL